MDFLSSSRSVSALEVSKALVPTQNATKKSASASAIDGDEPIQKIWEPFSKDQQINLLREATEKHADMVGWPMRIWCMGKSSCMGLGGT